jgi:Holliday junction DNA helicase RuvB
MNALGVTQCKPSRRWGIIRLVLKISSSIKHLPCSVCGTDDGRLFLSGESICLDCKIRKLSTHRPSWNEMASPSNFDQYIGQETVKSELETMLAASNQHHIPIQACLFSGSYGLGKTSIAKIFANRIGKWDIATATELKSPTDLNEQAEVVIIDEIHAMKENEWLLKVMDTGEKIILGATTTAGSLSGPLRSRFISFVLQPYSVEELQVMITNVAKRIQYICPPFLSLGVAQRGKGVARIALFLFKRIYDRIVLNNMKVTPDLLNLWFHTMGIDHFGLDTTDRAYLNALSNTPIGIQNLCAVTGMDRITIEEVVEPFLLSRGFVKRTPKGRVIGDKIDLSLNLTVNIPKDLALNVKVLNTYGE